MYVGCVGSTVSGGGGVEVLRVERGGETLLGGVAVAMGLEANEGEDAEEVRGGNFGRAAVDDAVP